MKILITGAGGNVGRGLVPRLLSRGHDLVVTARGVTAAIDLGLHLVERLAGPEARRRVSVQIDYPWPDGADDSTLE